MQQPQLSLRQSATCQGENHKKWLIKTDLCEAQKENVHYCSVVVNSQTILQNEGEVLLPVTERQRNPNRENSSGWGMQTYIMSAGIIKKDQMQYFLSAQTTALRLFHPDGLAKRLQRLPIPPDKDHLVGSDVFKWNKAVGRSEHDERVLFLPVKWLKLPGLGLSFLPVTNPAGRGRELRFVGQ